MVSPVVSPARCVEGAPVHGALVPLALWVAAWDFPMGFPSLSDRGSFFIAKSALPLLVLPMLVDMHGGQGCWGGSMMSNLLCFLQIGDPSSS